MIPAEPTRIPAGDLAWMRKRFRRSFRGLRGESKAQLDRLFEQIARPGWYVEWNLPRWMAQALHLQPAVQCSLVAANVFGLGYIRLLDDLQDGDLDAREQATALELGDRLLRCARAEFLALLGDAGWFWDRYAELLAAWRRASAWDFSSIPDVLAEAGAGCGLSDIGAPLLIGCAAAYALADQPQPFEAYAVPVRDYLTAAVLYDHLRDWRLDLERGRPNLFVHWLIHPLRGQSADGSLPVEIVRAMADTRQVRRYAEQIEALLSRAAQGAAHAGLDGFAKHLARLGDDARASAQTTLSGIEGMLRRAERIVFPVQS